MKKKIECEKFKKLEKPKILSIVNKILVSLLLVKSLVVIIINYLKKENISKY